eukprot:symbB.v1.2.034696.t1/scaffold4526.1/size39880/2
MAAAFDGLERLVSASSSLIGTAAIALPDRSVCAADRFLDHTLDGARRLPDASTLAHARAADTVYWAASWLLRGPELRVVTGTQTAQQQAEETQKMGLRVCGAGSCTPGVQIKRPRARASPILMTSRSPFLCETGEDLLAYYESLPLGRRLDGLFGVLLTLELLSSANILRRENYPRARRCLDVYCVAVGIAGVAPQHLFYRLHYWTWAYETQRAVREVSLPMPSPFSTQVGQILGQAWASLRDVAGAGSSDLKVQTSSTAPWALVLLLASVGGVWWLGEDCAREIWVSSCQRVKEGLYGLFGLSALWINSDSLSTRRSDRNLQDRQQFVFAPFGGLTSVTIEEEEENARPVSVSGQVASSGRLAYVKLRNSQAMDKAVANLHQTKVGDGDLVEDH